MALDEAVDVEAEVVEAEVEEDVDTVVVESVVLLPVLVADVVVTHWGGSKGWSKQYFRTPGVSKSVKKRWPWEPKKLASAKTTSWHAAKLARSRPPRIIGGSAESDLQHA